MSIDRLKWYIHSRPHTLPVGGTFVTPLTFSHPPESRIPLDPCDLALLCPSTAVAVEYRARGHYPHETLQVKKCLYEHALSVTLPSPSRQPSVAIRKGRSLPDGVFRRIARGEDDNTPLIDISILAHWGSVAEATVGPRIARYQTSESGNKGAAGRSAASVRTVCAEAATATRAG